ncbi:MAG: hypothetical protein GY913_25830 [Proteobacteria bacterium]|nr:hypothetical protein [Pseudomonadota bacterium]MCP4920336.1 hypothetical protein [Pseudomonadota bacterium]
MKRLNAILETLGEVFAWLKERRLAWLAPLVFLLLALGGMLALAAAVPAISPFVYLLF